jgi:hypothetical protein
MNSETPATTTPTDQEGPDADFLTDATAAGVERILAHCADDMREIADAYPHHLWLGGKLARIAERLSWLAEDLGVQPPRWPRLSRAS